MHPHLDDLETEKDDESNDQCDFGVIAEHPVNFMESVNESDESSDEEIPSTFTKNNYINQEKCLSPRCIND